MAESNVKPDSTDKPAKSRRRWYQFSLRTAGIGIFLVCLLLGAFAWWRDRAERQRKVVEELREFGAEVVYRYVSLTSSNPTHTDVYDVPVPEDEFFLCAWLRSWFGEDFVSSVDAVYLEHAEHAPPVPVSATQTAMRLLKHCPYLRTLRLEANGMDGSEFEKLPIFDTIEELALVCRADRQGTLCDDNLAPLRRSIGLRHLELTGQPIGDKGISHLQNCRHLEVLKLGNTGIGDKGVEKLCALDELFWLELNGTRTSDIGIQHLRRLTKLRILSLDDLNITGEGLVEIGPLTHLQNLDLNSTNVTDAALKHLKQFPNLETLDLNWTKVTGKGIPEFASVPKIDTIWLGGCPITDESISGVEIPEGIYMLVLGRTKISDAGFCKLKLPRSLGKIDLSESSIGDASLDYLHNVPDLNLIEIKGTSVSSRGIQRLIHRFPECTIHH